MRENTIEYLTTLIGQFIERHGQSPNTVLVGPDHPFARMARICNLQVKVRDDLTIAVALL